MPLILHIHKQQLSMCQLPPNEAAPIQLLARSFTYFFRTHDEATLICPTKLVPAKVTKTESGFIALEFVGPFDFALTGVLTQIANPLAEAGVAINALSTFNTDYILIKADKREAAIAAIKNAGHTINESDS